MATTTVRLDPDEENTLDRLAEIHGGRSNALRIGLRLLAAESERRTGLADLLADWEHDAGPVDDEAIAAMTDRFGFDSCRPSIRTDLDRRRTRRRSTDGGAARTAPARLRVALDGHRPTIGR